MNRRHLITAMGATAAVAPFGLSARAETRAALPELSRAAEDAYVYTLPLIESATARLGWHKAGGEFGKFLHMRRPTTPATQRITTPNNDTLNSRAWIDLAQGPVRLRWPATGDRYISLAMMDMYSNNFVVLGSRTTGPNGGDVTVVGPDAAVPPGAIRSPTRWMWILVRILVGSDDDIAKANALQDRIRLDAPALPGPLPAFANRASPWADYFASAGRLMAENPGPATDGAMLARFAALQLESFDPGRFTAAQGQAIALGLERARRRLASDPMAGQMVNGWVAPRPTLGDFRQDYYYRAQTAISAFAALPIDEAVYFFASGPGRDLKFDSAASWRLRLPGSDLPPADAFWSLVMYRAAPEGGFFLFDNVIDRYSIGDRTAGLVRGADGSIDIVMQRTRPADGRVNWLPTPQDAPFGIVFRIFRPRPAVFDGLWHLPAVERI